MRCVAREMARDVAATQHEPHEPPLRGRATQCFPCRCNVRFAQVARITQGHGADVVLEMLANVNLAVSMEMVAS